MTLLHVDYIHRLLPNISTFDFLPHFFSYFLLRIAISTQTYTHLIHTFSHLFFLRSWSLLQIIRQSRRNIRPTFSEVFIYRSAQKLLFLLNAIFITSYKKLLKWYDFLKSFNETNIYIKFKRLILTSGYHY